MDNVFCNLPPFPPMGGKGGLRVVPWSRANGMAAQRLSACGLRGNDRARSGAVIRRNRYIKAPLPFAVSLLAECQRWWMKTGFLLHEYSKQSKRLFGCWHNRGSFGGGKCRNVTNTAHTGGECQSVGQLLRSGERPTGPLLMPSKPAWTASCAAYHLTPRWWAMGAKVSGSRIKDGARAGGSHRGRLVSVGFVAGHGNYWP